METQSGARPTLVDPFGRELEAWLQDAPPVHAPYVPDLVVPPVTGPVALPVLPASAGPEEAATGTAGPEDVAIGTAATADVESMAAQPVAAAAVAEPAAAPAVAEPVAAASVADVDAAPAAFRRDRGRHASACAPTFPEPPARISLRVGDLAVELAPATGRSTIERITILEEELRRREDDRARFRAWEARTAHTDDPEYAAAHAWAIEVFADLLTSAVVVRHAVVVPAVAARPRSDQDGTAADLDDRIDESIVAPVAPVAAVTRPTPLVPPATGPSAIDHEAFMAALRAHTGTEAAAPASFPLAPVAPASATTTDEAGADATPLAETAPESASASVATPDAESGVAADRAPGWWARLVARVLRLLGRA